LQDFMRTFWQMQVDFPAPTIESYERYGGFLSF
jgi:hypothetical protein